jgi:hypothetical protein
MIDSYMHEIEEQNRQLSARLGKMRERGGPRALLSRGLCLPLSTNRSLSGTAAKNTYGHVRLFS